MAAYAIRVGSLSAVEARLRETALPSRRIGAALVAPFPEALGAGAWLFVQNAADLPWRA